MWTPEQKKAYHRAYQKKKREKLLLIRKDSQNEQVPIRKRKTVYCSQNGSILPNKFAFYPPYPERK